MILLLLVMVMVEDTQPSFLKDTHSQDVVLVVGHVTRYLGQSKSASRGFIIVSPS